MLIKKYNRVYIIERRGEVMKKFISKYKHALLALYTPAYLLCFQYLEKTITTDFTALNSPVDDIIPFIPVFIIPYLLWFVYVAGSAVYFIFASQRDFVKLMSFLIIGMTAYIIICYFFPNGLYNFRPAELPDDNFFCKLVAWLYRTDTSTNVFPSIHVYNSIGVHVAINKSDKIKSRLIKNASFILCVLICLSTIFLKQHSIIDVVGGCVMGRIVYILIYKTKFTDFIDQKTWN